MTVERAKMFGWTVVGGNGTLKKAALIEVLETLLTEIERLEGAKNTEQQLQPENGQQICTNKGCAGYSNGYCISFENCPVKAVSG